MCEMCLIELDDSNTENWVLCNECDEIDERNKKDKKQ